MVTDIQAINKTKSNGEEISNRTVHQMKMWPIVEMHECPTVWPSKSLRYKSGIVLSKIKILNYIKCR